MVLHKDLGDRKTWQSRYSLFLQLPLEGVMSMLTLDKGQNKLLCITFYFTNLILLNTEPYHYRKAFLSGHCASVVVTLSQMMTDLKKVRNFLGLGSVSIVTGHSSTGP